MCFGFWDLVFANFVFCFVFGFGVFCLLILVLQLCFVGWICCVAGVYHLVVFVLGDLFGLVFLGFWSWCFDSGVVFLGLWFAN